MEKSPFFQCLRLFTANIAGATAIGIAAIKFQDFSKSTKNALHENKSFIRIDNAKIANIDSCIVESPRKTQNIL